AGLPVLITAGIPPTAYPGSMVGARDPEGHLWLQQAFDQNGIVRQYTKWDHLLKAYDNAPALSCPAPCRSRVRSRADQSISAFHVRFLWPRRRPQDSRPWINSGSDVR